MDNNALSEFAKDVLEGLTSRPKHLSSKYFYDERGSKIFQDIMQMQEYYLTDCELEIFNSHKQEIFKAFAEQDDHFVLVELGAGDGTKTKVLLNHFLNQQIHFEYIPIDISGDAVRQLVKALQIEFPQLVFKGKIGDYHHILEEINAIDYTKKILLFLGSNIGNFDEVRCLNLLTSFKSVMHSGDLLFIGFDMKKDQEIILKAYDDPYGHTAAFNLNLLRRINNELGANFDLKSFSHHEKYDPTNGAALSFLVSQKAQVVRIDRLNQNISFDKKERIFMEISQKYDLDMIGNLAKNSGFEIVMNFFDRRQYFVNSLWRFP